MLFRTKWLILALISIMLTLIVGCQAPGDLAAEVAQQGPGNAPLDGDIAPDFIVPLLSGDSQQLSDLQGRPVILYFWATWCGSCTFEMPIIDAFYQEKADTGLVVLAINIGQGEETVQEFITEGGYTFPVGLDGSMDIGRAYRLLAFPSTFFIDSEGVIRNIRMGPISHETLQERLELIQ